MHRDIKGGNLLVSHAGRLKITDFGCSKRFEALQQRAFDLKGTVAFMAPEVVRHRGRGYGKEADIWSVGCTVLQVVVIVIVVLVVIVVVVGGGGGMVVAAAAAVVVVVGRESTGSWLGWALVGIAVYMVGLPLMTPVDRPGVHTGKAP